MSLWRMCREERGEADCGDDQSGYRRDTLRKSWIF